VLTIKGERNRESEVKKADYLKREVSYGGFERRMTLPEGTQTDRVKATFKRGVLEITLPLAKETVAKKAPIEAAAEKKVETSKKRNAAGLAVEFVRLRSVSRPLTLIGQRDSEGSWPPRLQRANHPPRWGNQDLGS
jgi:hypothetical protein